MRRTSVRSLNTATRPRQAPQPLSRKSTFTPSGSTCPAGAISSSTRLRGCPSSSAPRRHAANSARAGPSASPNGRPITASRRQPEDPRAGRVQAGDGPLAVDGEEAAAELIEDVADLAAAALRLRLGAQLLPPPGLGALGQPARDQPDRQEHGRLHGGAQEFRAVAAAARDQRHDDGAERRPGRRRRGGIAAEPGGRQDDRHAEEDGDHAGGGPRDGAEDPDADDVERDLDGPQRRRREPPPRAERFEGEAEIDRQQGRGDAQGRHAVRLQDVQEETRGREEDREHRPPQEQHGQPPTTFAILNMGRYMATSMPPTMAPMTTIMIGSIAAVSASTAASTSSS